MIYRREEEGREEERREGGGEGGGEGGRGGRRRGGREGREEAHVSYCCVASSSAVRLGAESLWRHQTSVTLLPSSR